MNMITKLITLLALFSILNPTSVSAYIYRITVNISDPLLDNNVSSPSLTLVRITASSTSNLHNITRVELHLNGELACYKEKDAGANETLEEVRFGPHYEPCPLLMILGNGTHQLMARAQDSAGNWGTTTSSITLNPDTTCQPTGRYRDIKHMWAHHTQENIRHLGIKEENFEKLPYNTRLDYGYHNDDTLNWFDINLQKGDNAYGTVARSPRFEVYNPIPKYPMNSGDGIWEFSANVAAYQPCGTYCGNNVVIFQMFSVVDAWAIALFLSRIETDGIVFKDRGTQETVSIAKFGETFHFRVSIDWDTNRYSLFVNCQPVPQWQNKPLWNPHHGNYIFRFGAYGQTSTAMVNPVRIHYHGVKMINYKIKGKTWNPKRGDWDYNVYQVKHWNTGGQLRGSAFDSSFHDSHNEEESQNFTRAIEQPIHLY